MFLDIPPAPPAIVRVVTEQVGESYTPPDNGGATGTQSAGPNGKQEEETPVTSGDRGSGRLTDK